MCFFCEHGNEPWGSVKKACYFLTRWATNDFSKNILLHWVRWCKVWRWELLQKFISWSCNTL